MAQPICKPQRWQQTARLTLAGVVLLAMVHLSEARADSDDVKRLNARRELLQRVNRQQLNHLENNLRCINAAETLREIERCQPRDGRVMGWPRPDARGVGCPGW